MRLAAAAGLFEPLPADVGQEAYARMVGEAADFLRAGGVLSLADWSALSESEKRALVDAGNAVAAERAAAIGLASHGPAAAMAVGAAADGGAALRDLSLQSVLSDAARRVAREPSIPAEGVAP